MSESAGGKCSPFTSEPIATTTWPFRKAVIMKRRSFRFIAPAACAAFVLAPTAASAVSTPAPPGQASGVAVQVGSLLDISKTGATAGSGSPSAESSVVRLGGEPLLGLGGTQSGNGQIGGALLDTANALPARVEVAPWTASVDGSGSATHQAKSSAAVARAGVPDVVEAGVLTSQSEASWSQQKSSGHAVSDGVNVGLLNAINAVLLHSETSSEGRGHSYLVGVNGTEIGTDDQLGASPLCAVNAGGLLSLSCLTASGGAGADGLTSGAAEVLEIDPAIDAIAMADPVAAFNAASSSGTGAGPTESTPLPAVAAGETVRGAAPDSAATDTAAEAVGETTGHLPRTGTTVAALAGAALAALFAGVALRGLRPRLTSR
jgi:hypothetical protein